MGGSSNIALLQFLFSLFSDPILQPFKPHDLLPVAPIATALGLSYLSGHEAFCKLACLGARFMISTTAIGRSLADKDLLER